MDFATILLGLKALNAALGTADDLIAAYEKLRGSLSTDQQAEIDAELADYRSKNDQLYARLDAKLAAASER